MRHRITPTCYIWKLNVSMISITIVNDPKRPMFDPRLLRAFVAILDAGSFTRAADRLHMTQSTISQQLARLEDGVGQVLVDRDARPISATPSGERLLGYARRILALQHEARTVLGDPAGTTSIRIGLPEDIFSGPMAVLFRDFAREHREIRLDVTAGLSRQLTRRYRGGEFDIAVVKESAPSADAAPAFRSRWAGSRGRTPAAIGRTRCLSSSFRPAGSTATRCSSESSASGGAGMSPSRAAACPTCWSRSRPASASRSCRSAPPPAGASALCAVRRRAARLPPRSMPGSGPGRSMTWSRE